MMCTDKCRPTITTELCGWLVMIAYAALLRGCSERVLDAVWVLLGDGGAESRACNIADDEMADCARARSELSDLSMREMRQSKT